MPNLYIIAGCNGAGKTTASYTILPEILGCYEFINADEIAKGLSPFKPENAGFEAVRIMLEQIDKHIVNNSDFAVETTLSSKHYVEVIKKAKNNGYFISLIFFWLSTPEKAKERVKKRVEEGGHNIPSDIIERRFKRGLYNFFQVYIHECDRWIFIDNNSQTPGIIAEKGNMINNSLYTEISKQSNEYKY